VPQRTDTKKNIVRNDNPHPHVTTQIANSVSGCVSCENNSADCGKAHRFIALLCYNNI